MYLGTKKSAMLKLEAVQQRSIDAFPLYTRATEGFRLRVRCLDLSARRAYSTRRGGIAAAQVQGPVSQAEALKQPIAADHKAGESLEKLEGTKKESLALLEWPALCRQVAAFASTPMAAQWILLSGLPIGRSKVRCSAAKLCQ